MHVALNATFWNRPETGSGQYLRQLVHHLHRHVSDIRLSLVAPQIPGEPALDAVPAGVAVHPVPVRPGHRAKVWFEQRQFPAWCRRVQADLAHVPYWGSPLRSPVPVVVTVHDLTTLLLREYRRRVAARLYTALVSAAARGASQVITDSQASRQDILQRLDLPADRVTRVYLAAGPSFSPRNNLMLDMAVQRKYELPDAYVLYLGGYARHKNVLTLLQAYTYVARALGPDYPLVLAGRRPPAAAGRPDYPAFIAAHGLEDRVRWLGFVAEAEKPSLYRGASCFVFPSRHEGFGLPPLEAMACGVPVVTAAAGSLPEIVGNAGFCVDPDDSREMAGAIIATCIQDDLAADMRQKGLAQARRFSWQQTAVETGLVYDRVLAGR